jgi:uncharacterized pyridoxamine 5'-phosphate oxidase family protein
MELSEKMKGLMNGVAKKAEEIIKRMQAEGSGTKRMYVFVSAQCPFCEEYLSNLKTMKLEVQPIIYNAFATEEGQALSLFVKFDKLPLTLVMGADDKFKGGYPGVKTEEELNKILGGI